MSASGRIYVLRLRRQDLRLQLWLLGFLRGMLRRSHFPDGSMGPKVEAALRFVERGGRRAIIADLFEAEAALAGLRGTQISPG